MINDFSLVSFGLVSFGSLREEAGLLLCVCGRQRALSRVSILLL